MSFGIYNIHFLDFEKDTADMEFNVQEQTNPKDLSTETEGSLTPAFSLGNQPWQEWLTPMVDSFAKVPEYVGRFFSEYKQPLTTLGLLILSFISVKIMIAVLGAIDDVPLLAPLFPASIIPKPPPVIIPYPLRVSFSAISTAIL